MKKQKNFYINIIITIAMLVIFLLFFTYQFKEQSETKVLNTLAEISDQSVRIIENEVEENKKLLINIATLLEQQEVYDEDALIAMLRPVDKQNGFKRMGLVYADHRIYSTVNDMFILTDQQYTRFEKAMAGETTVSDVIKDFADGNSVNVYTTPVHFKNGTNCVLFGTFSTDYYRENLSVSSFKGNGYSYVIKENGDCVLGSSNPLGIPFDNFYKQMKIISAHNTSTMDMLAKQVKQGKSGVVSYIREDGDRYLYYQPLNINDWYLLSEIPVSVVENRVNGMLVLAYGLMACCTFAIVYLAFRIIHMNNKHHKNIDNMLFVDDVTGYASKVKFHIDVTKLLEKSKKQYAIVCLNIKKFQNINDLYGYEEGNLVLCTIMETLATHLYANEYAARFDADHFVACLTYETKAQLHERVVALIKEIQNKSDHRHSDTPYQIKLIAGIYPIEKQDISLQTMIDRANSALRNAYEDLDFCKFYDDTIRKQALLHKEIEDCFEGALEHRQFQVYMQPKWNVHKECYEGAEALVRWIKDGVMWQSPSIYIPVLEKSGQILELDEYILKEVCRFIKTMLQKGYKVEPISINVSMLHLYRLDFVDAYLKIIDAAHVPYELIQLEMTETAIFTNTSVLVNILGQFRSRGIKILMDDFGSGYSSINLLQNMPIDILKIDKSLIDDVVYNHKGKRIVEITIELAHSLGMEVVGEGLESKIQYDMLKTINIDYVQKHYFAKAISLEQYEKEYVKK
ncbi:MAG: GGDEF domain-containing protein [Erysipelotrichia bacterium]|nr:GGDEF domain-containing protein [Erysipelotrichia bacterium]NCC54309.1 GGDEF domain-containing protein [Erysipelotrichia bacterium]